MSSTHLKTFVQLGPELLALPIRNNNNAQIHNSNRSIDTLRMYNQTTLGWREWRDQCRPVFTHSAFICDTVVPETPGRELSLDDNGQPE